jgi:hypothetical protein
VKRWPGGDQRERRVGSGVLVAEKHFRRVHPFDDAQQLFKAARRKAELKRALLMKKLDRPRFPPRQYHAAAGGDLQSDSQVLEAVDC